MTTNDPYESGLVHHADGTDTRLRPPAALLANRILRPQAAAVIEAWGTADPSDRAAVGSRLPELAAALDALGCELGPCSSCQTSEPRCYWKRVGSLGRCCSSCSHPPVRP